MILPVNVRSTRFQTSVLVFVEQQFKIARACLEFASSHFPFEDKRAEFFIQDSSFIIFLRRIIHKIRSG